MIIDIKNHFTMENPKLEKSFKSGKICERYWGEDGKMHIRISQETSRTDAGLKAGRRREISSLGRHP